jgi:hypothetical protein
MRFVVLESVARRVYPVRACLQRAVGMVSAARFDLGDAMSDAEKLDHIVERAAWLLLVQATTLRADASCEHDPLDALERAHKMRAEALAILQRCGVDVEQITDPHGLWNGAEGWAKR